MRVWIFAVAISLPKTGNRNFSIMTRFRLLHSNGKTVCTTAAAVGRFCGGSAPTSPTSPKEQNGMLRNREGGILVCRYSNQTVFLLFNDADFG